MHFVSFFFAFVILLVAVNLTYIIQTQWLNDCYWRYVEEYAQMINKNYSVNGITAKKWMNKTAI